MKRILIVVSAARFMRWQQRLRDRLAKRWPEAEVAFRCDAEPDDQPSAVTQLLNLERLLIKRARPALCDRLAPPISAADAAADVIVDLTGGADMKSGARMLRPLYDGHRADQAAINAIFSGVAPILAIQDVATGDIAAQGLPSFECEPALTLYLDAVYSRVALLIEQAIAVPRPSATPPARATRSAPTPGAYLAKRLAFAATRAMYRLCCHSPHWRIGWRFNDGPGALETGSLAGPAWNALYDCDMGFAADPFPVQWRGRMGVFFESMDYRSGRGAIRFQAFGAEGPIGHALTALAEPWHLSYPFLIEDAGVLYMAPEASASQAITLYRCVEFPLRWEPVAKLVDNVEAADATIFRHGGRYWMTSVVRDGYGGYSDTLAIHHAATLLGPWEPHRLSPVLVDSRFARPAGAVVPTPRGLFRPVQDCEKGYGKAIAIMRIDALDAENFRQSFVSRMTPGARWTGGRLHTLNRCGGLECIDGAILAPKYLPFRRLAQHRIDSRISTAERLAVQAL
ncbi:hypothetical protein [Methylocystis echinoides]|uniref:glucosamine inositolphosphorylceramide transferase family protein n=1 Tax=Methylocystis echinoides TaxID=29468 RepID=UPI0034301F9F